MKRSPRRYGPARGQLSLELLAHPGERLGRLVLDGARGAAVARVALRVVEHHEGRLDRVREVREPPVPVRALGCSHPRRESRVGERVRKMHHDRGRFVEDEAVLDEQRHSAGRRESLELGRLDLAVVPLYADEPIVSSGLLEHSVRRHRRTSGHVVEVDHGPSWLQGGPLSSSRQSSMGSSASRSESRATTHASLSTSYDLTRPGPSGVSTRPPTRGARLRKLR